MIKIAVNTLTKEKIDGKYGTFEAYMVKGDSTRNIKDILSQLGFKWYGPKSAWWISSKSMTDSIKARLQEYGVVTVEQPLTDTPIDNKTDQQTIRTPVAAQPPERKPESKKWATENEKASAWYGFPINKEINSFETDITSKEKTYKAQVKIERTYFQGKGSSTYHETFSREHKGLPKYLFHVSIPELDINYSIFHQATKKWGTYNEEEYLIPVKENILNILNDPVKKLQRGIEFKEEMVKRTPEYKDFLNKLGKKEINITYPFIVVDKDYGGEFNLAIYSLGMDEKSADTSLMTKLDDQTSPRDHVLRYKDISIWNTYTIEDFHKKINEYLINDREKVQNEVIKFLKSFPYLEEQKKDAFKDFQVIKNYITNKPSESQADEILNIIKSRGYIRPSLRGNRKGEDGNEVQTKDEQVKWVIDSKKIVNDAYGSNKYLSESPDYFYAVVAYYVHRKVRGIFSFTDMMLTEAMGSWLKIMNRYGAGFNFKEVMYSIEEIGSIIVNKIYGKKTKEQMNEEFRNWFDDSTKDNKQEYRNTETNNSLSELSIFAQKYGIDPEGIENNLIGVYRTLVKKLHPDLVQDPNEKIIAEKSFKELQGIWDRIPQNLKTAMNWYDLYTTSSARE